MIDLRKQCGVSIISCHFENPILGMNTTIKQDMKARNATIAKNDMITIEQCKCFKRNRKKGVK